MSDTLGSLRQEILLELRGDLATPDDVTLVNAKINNALEAVWMAMMKIALSRFFGSDSPVNFTLASGAQRVQLVSIADPTVNVAAVGTAGGGLPQRTYFYTYTFVTESGSETNPAPLASILVALNNLAQFPAPAEPSGGAFGWNLYAGQGQTTIALQNQQPLPFGVPYTELPEGIQDYPVNQQLPPSSNSTADNISYITHLEIQLPDTTYRAYNQADIDSLAMRGLAATMASASQYQTYAWDLINGRTIEVRPPAGTTLVPRYFYVAKPRRLRYDPAEIPYTSIAGVHEFLTNQAIADLKLSLDEYISSQAYQGKAGGIKLEIQTSLAQEAWAKNTRITPFLY
jgi:hypothetical protein